MEKWDFNEMASMSNSDEAPIIWAIENYAYRTFGKHINNLDEYELNKILIDLQDVETLKKYLPNQATAAANIREWGIYWAMETAFPVSTLVLEWASSVPVVWDIISNTMRWISIAIWATLANTVLSPVWIPMEQQLNSKEERLDFYEALWAIWLWFSHEWLGWKETRWKWDKKTLWAFKKFLNSDAEETLGWKLWEEKIIDLDSNNWWPKQTVLWWIKEKASNKSEMRLREKEEKIKQKMYDKANQTLVDPEVWENKQAADAYNQLSPEAVERINKSKSKSEAAIQELDKISKAYENAENAIVNTIDKMYWLDYSYENPIETEQWWRKYTSNKPRKYIDEWIKIMKEIAEYQEEQQYIDLAEQIAKDGNLTPYNIIEMARSLSKQFELRSKWQEWAEIANMKKRIDSTRQWLKNILKRELDKTEEWRELWVNPLEYYDSLWSPVIWTRSNIVQLRSAWNKAKSRINKTTLNRVLWWLGKIPFTKESAARATLWEAKKLWWPSVLDLITKENNLGKSIKAIKELWDKLSSDPTKEQIDSIMRDWEKNHPWMMDVMEWVIEWEVIEPEQWKWTKWRNPYLEEMFDTVEIEEPKWLWKNEWVWPDLQETIVVDESGYAWRRWRKTVESYKWQKKWEWWTPEKWNKSENPKTENKTEKKIEPKTPAEEYAAKYGYTLEEWKKRLIEAWISPEAVEVLIEKLSKKWFRTIPWEAWLF